MRRFLSWIAVVGLVTIIDAPVAVAASAPPGTSCSVFPADNVWNTDISTLPVHSRSAAWLSSSGAASGTLLHPDFGGPPYGIPFNVVDNTHATANFNFQYWSESDPVVATQQPQGPYPYGSDLKIEAPTDSHLLTINKDTCKLYETSGTDYNGAHTGWSGAIFDLNSNALRPDSWTSADAAGLPIFPGLVRLDEVQAGAITHAIRFTVQQSDKSHLWPARHDAGAASNVNLPPMGARFRLKSTFDLSSFSASAQVVLVAMKRYGLIVADNGSNWFFQGTMDSGWNSEPYATMVSQLKTVPASAFEAVDESSLMADPNSGRAIPPARCAMVGATASPASPQTSGTQVTITGSASGCPNPQYEFWARWQGSSTWQLLRGYSNSNTYVWNSTGALAGTEQFGVWARDSTSAAAYDTYASIPFTVTTPSCASVAVSVAPATVVHGAGTHVTITGAATGCTSSPRYQFWMRAASQSAWQLVQGYSAGATYDWNSRGALPGTVYFGVWVRDTASLATYDAVASTPVTLT